MSIRARAGAVQVPVQPGSRVALSRLSISAAIVSGAWSGQTGRRTHASAGGAQPEYQRCRGYFGHWERGRNRTVVSTIEYGAGSVAVSERPTLPKTLATSLNWLMARSILRSPTAASPSGTPGNVDGM